jgi:hypothetical protein
VFVSWLQTLEQHWLSVVQLSPCARQACPPPSHAPPLHVPEQQLWSSVHVWPASMQPPPPGPHTPFAQLFEQQSALA